MDQENDSLGILCVGTGAKETYLVSLAMSFISHVMGDKFLILSFCLTLSVCKRERGTTGPIIDVDRGSQTKHSVYARKQMTHSE